MRGDSFMYFKEIMNVSKLFYNKYYTEFVKLTFNVKLNLSRIRYGHDSLR